MKNKTLMHIYLVRDDKRDISYLEPHELKLASIYMYVDNTYGTNQQIKFHVFLNIERRE